MFVGMGKNLYDYRKEIRDLMNSANDILGFDILSVMFDRTEEDLKKTKITSRARGPRARSAGPRTCEVASAPKSATSKYLPKRACVCTV